MTRTAPVSPRPAPDEFAPYYARYVDLVEAGDIVHILRSQVGETVRLLRGLSDAQAGHRYAAGKWSIREMVGHMSDTERVFTYRAMRFARGDTTPLPSFDENAFVANANFDSRSLASLIDEFETTRAGSAAFFAGLNDAAWVRRGVASNNLMSVRGAAFVVAGHELHHRALLRTRYLQGA